MFALEKNIKKNKYIPSHEILNYSMDRFLTQYKILALNGAWYVL